MPFKIPSGEAGRAFGILGSAGVDRTSAVIAVQNLRWPQRNATIVSQRGLRPQPIEPRMEHG